MTLPWTGVRLYDLLVARGVLGGPPIHFGTVAEVGVTGIAILGASFLLAWGAETAEKDVPRAFAIAVLAVLAVAPEYAVDALFAWNAGAGVPGEEGVDGVLRCDRQDRQDRDRERPRNVFLGRLGAPRQEKRGAEDRDPGHAHLRHGPEVDRGPAEHTARDEQVVEAYSGPGERHGDHDPDLGERVTETTHYPIRGPASMK